MSLNILQPRSRVARVAPLVPAIAAARVRGITWNQIVQEIGAEIGIEPGAPGAADTLRVAYRAAVKQIERGRLMGPEPALVTPTVPAHPQTPPPGARPPLPGVKLAPASGLDPLDQIRADFDK